MSTIRDYHRPATIKEALDLLSRDDVVTVPLWWGHNPQWAPKNGSEEVVDLQMLELNQVTYLDSTLVIGAMTTLSQLVSHEMTPAAIVGLAKRDAPNTIRNVATLGGTVGAANAESPLPRWPPCI